MDIRQTEKRLVVVQHEGVEIAFPACIDHLYYHSFQTSESESHLFMEKNKITKNVVMTIQIFQSRMAKIILNSGWSRTTLNTSSRDARELLFKILEFGLAKP